MEDLDNIIDSTPEETPEQPAEEAETAPVEEPTPAEPKAEDPPMVPLAALQETRDQVRDLRTQLEGFQKAQQPKETPKPEFLDPEGASYFQGEMARMQAHMAAELSEAKARMTYGTDVVDRAFQEAQRQGVLEQFKGGDDPWGRLAKWGRQQAVAAEVGDDLDAWKAAQRAEIEKEVRAKLLAEQTGKAPSLAGETSATQGVGKEWKPADIGNILST